MPLSGNFIDKNGNEFRGIAYTITVHEIELEAKSQVNGPYDLAFKITTKEAHATPMPELPPTIHVYQREGRGVPFKFYYIKPHQRYYEEAAVFLATYPQNAFGSYILPPNDFAKMEVRFNLAGKNVVTAENEAARDRWQLQWEHWKNIDAFQESMREISADRIVDREESQDICFALEQWTAQLRAARDYVGTYRTDDPGLVAKNAGLENLQEEAERGLDLLAEVECE